VTPDNLGFRLVVERAEWPGLHLVAQAAFKLKALF